MTLTFEDFLKRVPTDDKDETKSIHEFLISINYKCKIEDKASGMFVAYSHPKTKRAFLNFFFRKSGLQTRIYAEGHKIYLDFIENLPPFFTEKINREKTCDGCAPTCTRGYRFSIHGTEHYKCRYYCFHFEVNAQTKPIIMELVKLENSTR